MKQLLIIISMVFSMMFADSAVGNWKLSGLRVDYYDIARAPASVIVMDAYGFGIGLSLAEIPAGLMFNHTPNGPFTNEMLQGAGVNLNVNLYPDGTGVVGEGSYYPDVDIGYDADGNPDCISTGQIYPITDSFNWNAPGNELTFPYVNILGTPSYNAMQGQMAYGLGVNGSGVFDNWTAYPTQIPTPSVLPGIFLADGTVLSYPAVYGGVTAGEWGGYYRQGEIGNSQMGQDLDVKFLLEWNATDGWESESGLGDDLTVDEDGDGTDYDRIFGLPYISSTYVNSTNPLCDITGGALAGEAGLTYPVAGDIVDALGGADAVGALVTGSCLQGVADGAFDACLGQVQDGVEAQCDYAGSPQAAVTGLCFDASQSSDFAGACAYYGAATALVVTCQQLGFDDETCAAAGEQGVGGVEAYCQYMTGYDCATAGIDQCTVLTDPTFAAGLCELLAYSLTESETCDEWASSFEDDWLDNTATQVLGVTCTDFAAGLQAGLAAGDPTAIATIDGLFAGVAGMTCSDYGANYVGMCVEEVAGATTMYVMDTSLEAWGLFLTYNAASVQQYLAAGYDLGTIAYYFPELFVNDSGSDFDPSCYYTGETCGGRLLMNFAPTCIPEIEAHQIIAEFVDLDALGCDGTGDVAGGFDDLNGDGVWDEEYEGPAGDGIVNVVDVVKLVGHILGTSPLGGFLLCEADLNGDGIINVVDVVAIVNIILGSGRVGDASEATINYNDSEIAIAGNGYIGGIDITVEFANNDFDISLNEDFIGDFTVNNNTARILMVGIHNNLDGNIIDVINGEITAITMTENGGIVNSNGIIEDVTIIMNDGTPTDLVDYKIYDAYPNPFNPSTTIEMELNIAANVSVKVYNLTGQLVDVIAEGNLPPNDYNFTWNADNLASGVYFITTQIGNDLKKQKVILIK